MSKEELRAGLESWIKDTRETAGNLEPDPAAGVDLQRLERAVRGGSGEELDDLAQRLADDVAALVEKLEVLKSAAARISPEPLAGLEEALERLAATGPLLAEPAAASDREEAVSRRISAAAWTSEVLEADVPVLVNLVLEGHAPCLEARQALESARQICGGEVKLCDIDLLEVDAAVLPHLLKLGRGFLVDHLPAVLLFWHGRKVGDIRQTIDPESVADLVRSETGEREP